MNIYMDEYVSYMMNVLLYSTELSRKTVSPLTTETLSCLK